MIDESLTESRERIKNVTSEINKKQREIYKLVEWRGQLKRVFRNRQSEVKRYLKKEGLWEGSNFRDVTKPMRSFEAGLKDKEWNGDR